MKDRPILFSAPMVRAIGDGTKTQTRRAIKLPLEFMGGAGDAPDNSNDPSQWGAEDANGRIWALAAGPDVDHVFPCRYGEPGERLWVKESYWIDRDTGEFKWYVNDIFTPDRERDQCRLRPSIHMPRKVSRLLLEIAEVRVQMLQSISEEDARAEGVESEFAPRWFADKYGALCGRQHRYGFASIWAGLNGEDSWHANPWVWAVSFKRIEGTT